MSKSMADLPKSNPVQAINDGMGGLFELSEKDGLVHFEHYSFVNGNDNKGGKVTRICNFIKVIAHTSDHHQQGTDSGRLVAFDDERGTAKELFIPLRLMVGNALELGALLMDNGLVITNTNKARQLLTTYLSIETRKNHIYTSDRIGWHGDTYLLPKAAISPNDALALRYKANGEYPPFEQRGSLDEWINGVSKYAIGNNRLLLALSLAFAAPLSRLMGNSTSIGFHFRGASRTGKSTIAKAALSVYGEPMQRLRTWHSTATALEGTALAFNDNLLVLDELSQSDEQSLSQTIYGIGNGIEKGRGKAQGGNRPFKRWHLLYLSTGEESLSTKLAKAKRKPNAGMDMRFIDLDADAGKGLGLFDTVPDGEDSGALSDLIQQNANSYHGTAGAQWLNYLVNHKDEVTKQAREAIGEFKRLAITNHHTAQHKSTSAYFALIGIAGEIATMQGLTGWNDGDAWRAAFIMFANWVDNFGHGLKESQAVIEQVTSFIQSHGASRFEGIYSDSDNSKPVINRAGFVRVNESNETEYLFFPATFKNEVLAGLDLRTAISALKDAGMLHPRNENESQQVVRVQALGNNAGRYYAITLKKES